MKLRYKLFKWLPRRLRPSPRIPGGWKIGDRCYFSHRGTKGILGLPGRAIGTVDAYDPVTNALSILYKGQVIVQQHTTEFGGISGVPPYKTDINDKISDR